MSRGDFWNIFFSILFVAMTFAMVFCLERIYADVPTWTWIPLFDLVLIVLAVFRMTRLFVYDVVMAFFRHWFEGYPKDTFMGTMSALVNCPWCLGLWFSPVVIFFYFLTPLAWFFILFLAVAGVSSFVQIFSNMIGWTAEYQKLRVKTLEEHRAHPKSDPRTDNRRV